MSLILAKHNKCRTILFAHHSILVARSRSIELFAEPELRDSSEDIAIVHPIKAISYGWIDGLSLAPSSMPAGNDYPSIAILIRAETGDPWQSDIHSIKRYYLNPNPEFGATDKAQEVQKSPYLFPPSLVDSIVAYRGFLRCPVLKLGEAGTSLYVSMSSEDIQHPTSNDLCGIVWPGPLNNSCSDAENTEASHVDRDLKRWKLFSTVEERWTTLDYIEHRGCIALGSIEGTVRVLYLVK